MMKNPSLFPQCSNPGPLAIVISGPSGVGKDAILNLMKERAYPFFFMTTCTTRQKRATEVDGRDYHFVTVQEFQELIETNGLLEWAKVYGNYYGVPKSPLKKALEEGRDSIIKVDIQGARNIKKGMPEAVFIFILPPSTEELTRRLNNRRTETAADLELRLKTAESELKQLEMFDYSVLNPCDDIDSAITDILSIVKAEKCRVKPRKVSL
jgi:guanylate kinase